MKLRGFLSKSLCTAGLITITLFSATSAAAADSKFLDDGTLETLAASIGVPWTTTEEACCAKSGGWPIVCDGGRVCGCDFSREGNADYYFHCLRISPKPAPVGPVSAD